MESERQQPRRPNPEEVEDLVAYWASDYSVSDEQVRPVIEDAYTAVFDHYNPGAPGCGSKLMLTVWSGHPSFYDCFVWKEGEIAKIER